MPEHWIKQHKCEPLVGFLIGEIDIQDVVEHDHYEKGKRPCYCKKCSLIGYEWECALE
jgi:hypothetical protein